MIATWLFVIQPNNWEDTVSYRWSTGAFNDGVNEYPARILSFDGISMSWDIERGGIISPTAVNFEVDNIDGTISKDTLTGQYCTITLLTDYVETRKWKVKISTVSAQYGVLNVNCVDILQEVLNGVYPNRPHPREVFPSVNHEVEEDDTYRIPVIFGQVYIPVMYVYLPSTDLGYYCLGRSADVSTIEEVKSPSSAGNNVWTSEDYSLTFQNQQGYALAQFNIAPTLTAGVYNPGTWTSDLKPLVKYHNPITGLAVNPADVLNTVLLDFLFALYYDIDYTETWEGMTPVYTGTWGEARAIYETWGIEWQGAIYEQTSRDTILNNLLAQCDSSIYVSDKIELHPFVRTSQETFPRSKIKNLTFGSSKIMMESIDSGRIWWAEAGTPQNELSGKVILPLESGGTTLSPHGTAFKADFISDWSVAQKLGLLHFQRKKIIEKISFTSTAQRMDSFDTLRPGQVVAISDDLFGGTYAVIVTDMHIHKDLSVDITGVHIEALSDFSTISESSLAPVPSVATNTVIPTMGAGMTLFGTGDPPDDDSPEGSIYFRI